MVQLCKSASFNPGMRSCHRTPAQFTVQTFNFCLKQKLRTPLHHKNLWQPVKILRPSLIIYYIRPIKQSRQPADTLPSDSQQIDAARTFRAYLLQTWASLLKHITYLRPLVAVSWQKLRRFSQSSPCCISGCIRIRHRITFSSWSVEPSTGKQKS